jgi:phytoene/squalene synthetase
MLQLFTDVSYQTSRVITHRYSTSFSLGTRLFDAPTRKAIYALYGFVRLADEIVDTFHHTDKAELLTEFRRDTQLAIARGISLNPVLHSFQEVVNRYSIRPEYIEAFFVSMEQDLDKTRYSRQGYDEYIYGSAEVVGLMCLQIFCKGDEELFQRLYEPARRLGAAFQKVNFLRDLKADFAHLGRTYFPNVDLSRFDDRVKAQIEDEIGADFVAARKGIELLPSGSKLGVYVAYVYYKRLYQKIRSKRPEYLLQARVRVPNQEKIGLMAYSFARVKSGLV